MLILSPKQDQMKEIFIRKEFTVKFDNVNHKIT